MTDTANNKNVTRFKDKIQGRRHAILEDTHNAFCFCWISYAFYSVSYIRLGALEKGFSDPEAEATSQTSREAYMHPHHNRLEGMTGSPCVLYLLPTCYKL